MTLQEKNAVEIVDLAERLVVRSFSAGTVARTDAEVADDGVVAFVDDLTAPRRTPCVDRPSHLVTADEGGLAAELFGGRGWTVFAPGGRVLHTCGGTAERTLDAAGLYPAPPRPARVSRARWPVSAG